MRVLLQSAMEMAASVMHSDELTPFVKVQHIVWAVGVAVLPDPVANKFIRLAFDHAPQSGLSRLLRGNQS
jgi:hypothetical protein